MDAPMLLVIGLVAAFCGFASELKSLAYHKWPLQQMNEEDFNKGVRWHYVATVILIISTGCLVKVSVYLLLK